ncbi:hypothetical protein PSC71_06255 [Devosia sp. J2-20]|jgi:hypothetical protein|uniref:Uncharacterized protein n=1 Tax=Devosia litorisediminis TaxID=2829817 RepID=A0A942I5Y7_9HYPH|nr:MULTISPECIES: hypothetical protein [Devosia]MBS3849606.1 hypothetical protein [Devosia litorisediminis]MCZ4347886.1 hypothetical protein [Devosia neptuniae]WDR00369.1 hypothetical protein PSC71_06255 [Devosia sp. J2-20]|tara:strand:+ start:2034 stop:2288 length:255 start_codon:yes stop_codon:yes gene_type:complete
MTLELIDIAVKDKQSHPRLAGRVTGHVRAVLKEELDGREHIHELSISVWADVAEQTAPDDVDMALMLKAAQIVKRMKASVGPPA